MARSESRVVVFVWATATSYLVASDLKPSIPGLLLLVSSSYLLTFGVYVLNALADYAEDRINSPNRPIPSGRVTMNESKLLFAGSIVGAFAIVSFVNVPTVGVYAIFLLLGIAYSLPRIHAKRKFQFKIAIPVSGAAVISLAGGVAAQELNLAIFLAALSFALFAMLTLLLGDIADMKGDLAAGIKSLPIVIGAQRSVYLVCAVPMIISASAILLFPYIRMNMIFLGVLLGISAYSTLTLSGLFKDVGRCRRIKNRMRVVHFVLQLAFIIGLLVL